MIDVETIVILQELELAINKAIDKLIVKRQSAQTLKSSQDKNVYFYRYICRKLEQALGYIHKAIDKVEYSKVEDKK